MERFPETRVQWWDAVYCTSGSEEPASRFTGSLGAIKTWAAKIEKEKRIRRSIFDSPNTFNHLPDSYQWGTGYWWLNIAPHEFRPGEKPPIEAYSGTTGKTYPTFDDLVEAETNGWLAIMLITGAHRLAGQTWPWVHGPFATKREAQNAVNRLRTRCKREADQYPGQTYKFFVRPAWKDQRG